MTTATYRGDVSKSGISKVECAVTYQGEKIPVKLPWLLISICAGSLVFLLVLILLLRYARRYNTTAYVTVPGTQHGVVLSKHKVNRKHPTVFLSGVQNETGVYLIVRKRAAKKMLGREIIVFCKGRPTSATVDSGGRDFYIILSGKEHENDT